MFSKVCVTCSTQHTPSFASRRPFGLDANHASQPAVFSLQLHRPRISGERNDAVNNDGIEALVANKSDKSDEDRDAAEAQVVEESNQIKFFIAEYMIKHLVNSMKSNEFVVAAYQRKFTWEDERKSKFIESVLMGLPIPFLLFWTRPAWLSTRSSRSRNSEATDETREEFAYHTIAQLRRIDLGQRAAGA
jgi:hypothetical protein